MRRKAGQPPKRANIFFSLGVVSHRWGYLSFSSVTVNYVPSSGCHALSQSGFNETVPSGLLVRFPIQEETRKSFAASLQDFIIYLIFAYIYIISIGVLYVYITPINSISHIVQSLHKVEFKEI